MGSGPSTLPERVCTAVQEVQVDEVLGDEALLKRTTQNATALYKAYRFCPRKVRPQQAPDPESEDPEPEQVDRAFVGGVRFWHLGTEVDLTAAEACCNWCTPSNILAGDSWEEGSDAERPSWSASIMGDPEHLVIRFQEPTPATEFAFKTHTEELRAKDPIEFVLEGSNDESNWLMLCKASDFAVPNARGEWTSRVALLDPAIAKEMSGKTASDKLDEATRKNGATDLQNWITGKPPRAPTEELAALMQCCKAQIVGEPQKRRDILFSMVHATCETMTDKLNAEEEKRRKASMRAKGKDKKGARADAISSLSARCATRLLLEPLLNGGPSGPLLELLNEQLNSGVLGIELPPEEEELPGPLKAAIESACDMCRSALQKGLEGGVPAAGSPAAGAKALRGAQSQGLKVAELLLRLAALRGSLGDVLAVAKWLLNNPGGELPLGDGIWGAARHLHEIRAPWGSEVFDEGKWLAASAAKKPTAIRSKLELSSASLGALEARGTFVEFHLLEGAAGCRVCLLPCGSEDTNCGIGVQSGQLHQNGELSDWEGSSGARDFAEGDVVGLWLNAASEVEVFVNGRAWGKLPECPTLRTAGCFAAIVGFESGSNMLINVGQSAFAYPNPGGPSLSWAEVAGAQTFDIVKAVMEIHVHDRATWSAALGAADRADSMVLGLMLIDMLARNASTVGESGSSSSKNELTFESPHPYPHYVDNKQKIEIPGATSLKITFDPQSRSEQGCDYIQFAKDEGILNKIGEPRTGSSWQALDVEGDTLWFMWHSDSSSNDWGYKFTVQATMRSTNVPLCVQADQVTIDAMAQLLGLPRSSLPPVAFEKLIELVGPNLAMASTLPEATKKAAGVALLSLAKEKSHVGAAAAGAFGECCSVLFNTPVNLLQAQLEMWESPGVYHPDAVSIVSGKISKSKQPFGRLVDDPAAGKLLDKFVDVVVGFPTDDGGEKAARLLWRVLCDCVSHLVGQRAKETREGWAAVFSAIQKILDGAVKALTAGSEPPFHRVLTLPLLHGVAAIPTFEGAPWESVVGLLPPVGTLIQHGSKGTLPIELVGAALSLIACLGRELVRLGSDQQEDEAGIAEILKLPLMNAVPRSALGDEYAGPPAGVGMVESSTGMILRKDHFKADAAADEKNAAFSEFISGTSERAAAAIKYLNTNAKGLGPAMLPARLHRLLFCILVKQQAALASVKQLLDAVSSGADPNLPALPKLWVQARRLDMWLLQVKQRQAASGKTGQAVLEHMEGALEILVSCEPIDPDAVVEAVEDDGLDALWEQQMMELQPAAAAPSKTMSFPSLNMPASNAADAGKRLEYLLKQIPQPNSGGGPSSAQQLKSFFEAKWFGKDDPLKALLLGLRDASVAAWRRAAGLSLLAWAVQQCAAGAEPWVTGLVLSSLSESWQQEVAVAECCAEMPALVALAAARQHALSSMVKLCIACDGRPQGTALKIMSVAALGGPWRPSDQNIILSTDVLNVLKPICPWAVEAQSANSEALQCSRAAWLALRSLVSLSYGAEAEKTSDYAKAVFSLLLEALKNMPKAQPDKPIEVSLSSMFGLDTARVEDMLVKKEPWDEFLEDIKSRLAAGEDFGGLEADSVASATWLEQLPPFFERFKLDQGKRTSIDELQNDEDVEWDDSIEWGEFDANSDGYLDLYEALALFVKLKPSFSAEFSSFPTSLPEGLPRYFGDKRGQVDEPKSLLASLPVSASVAAPRCALFRCMDGFLRAQLKLELSDMADEDIQTLLQVASGPEEPVMEAVLTLQILRRMSKMPAASLASVASTLLRVIAEPGNATSPMLAAQRARVLRDFFQQEGSFEVVGKTVIAALRGEEAKQQAAALKVLADAPALQTLAVGLTDSGRCTVIEDVAAWGARPPKISMHMGYCSSGGSSDYGGSLTVPQARQAIMNDDRYVGFYIPRRAAEDETVTAECYYHYGQNTGMDANADHAYYKKEVQPPSSALVLQHSAGLTEAVVSSSLHLQAEQCDVSRCSQADRACIVDVALASRTDRAWPLCTVLSQPDAASHFIKSGGLSKWLPLAIEAVPSKIGTFSPCQRSSISAVLRAEFPDHLERIADPSPPPPPAPVDADAPADTPAEAPADAPAEEVADASVDASPDASPAPKDKLDATVMKRAARALHLEEWPAAGTVLDLNEVQNAVRNIFKKSPERKVARLYALPKKEEEEDTDTPSKERFGLIDDVEKAPGISSSASSTAPDGPDHAAVHSLLLEVRNDSDQLENLVKEVVCWDRTALALQACLAVVLHASSPTGSEVDFSSAAPEQMAQLCLAFERQLDSGDMRQTARSAMVAMASKNMHVLSAVQELCMTHLFGSLACEKGAATSGGKSFEGNHPYNNYEDKSEEVRMPGARRLNIKFDSRCRSEEGCDNLTFRWGDGQEKTVSGRDGFPDFVIDSSKFTYIWHSDGSNTDWGYKFTVAEEGGNKGGTMPSFADGLWLLGFLLDMLKEKPATGTQVFTAEQILRPELVATLFAHVERDSDEKAVEVLSRFVEACSTHQVGFDWTNARHALSAMTRTAQEKCNQSRVQQCAALRLALPSVVVATEQPRFSSANSKHVQLLHNDSICVSQVPRETLCCVSASLKAVLFRRISDVEAWIGAVRTSPMGAASQTVCMLRMSDGAALIDATMDTSDPVSSDMLREVGVILDDSKNELTFDGQGFTRKFKLPLCASEGRWRLAAKLCGFGASVGAFTPSLSEKGLEDLRGAWRATEALMNSGSLPAEFLAESFNDWWSASSAATDQASQAESKWTSLSTGQLLVDGAGTEKYNGVYDRTTEDGRGGKPEWENEAGCKIFYEDFGMPGLSGWCMNEGDCNPPSPYAASLVNAETGEAAGPWFAVAEGAGQPPSVGDLEGPPTFEKLADFSPVRISSRSSPEFEVRASSVLVADKTTVVLLTMTNENCEPFLLCAERGGEPKRVSNSEFRCWGVAGCIFAPSSEWTAGASPTLHLSGGEGFEVVHLCSWQAAKKDKMNKLTPKLAKVFESPHPLPTDSRTALHVSMPRALGLTLQFSRESQLPEGTVALVTLDEAGLKPAPLVRKSGSADVVVPVNKGKMKQDAARGIIELVQGQHFKVGAAECYIHLPATRPIDWDPLPPAPPPPKEVKSPHPYAPYSNVKEHFVYPGASRMKVSFHTQSYTESGYDKLNFYRDENLSEHLKEYQGCGPWPDLEITGDSFWYTFTSDGGSEYWGYEFTVSHLGELKDDAGFGDAEMPTIFDEGVQLGAAGTLLFKGGSSADWQVTPEVTATQCEITNMIPSEDDSFMYATLDNIAPDGEGEKGTQSDWIMIPKGWSVAPNERSMIDNVVAQHGWATDCLVLADGTAIGTSNCQAGDEVKNDKLQVARCQNGGKAYRPGFALARVLVRLKNEPVVAEGADVAAPTEAVDGPPPSGTPPGSPGLRPSCPGTPVPGTPVPSTPREAEEKSTQDAEPGYVVRQSKAALTWLRPGLLAGEVSIDFSGAPLAAGDIAVGLVLGVQRTLSWPPVPPPVSEEAAVAEAVAGEEKPEEAKAEGEEAAEEAPPEPPSEAVGEELLITCPGCTELSGTYTKSGEDKYVHSDCSEYYVHKEENKWKFVYSGSTIYYQTDNGGSIPLGIWERDTDYSYYYSYAGLQVVRPISCPGPRRFAPAFEGCWVGVEDGLRKATIIGQDVRWRDGSTSRLEIKDRWTVSTTNATGKSLTGTLNKGGEIEWDDEPRWIRTEAYKFRNGDKVMLTTKYAKYSDGGSGPLHVGFEGPISSSGSGQQPYTVCTSGSSWVYEWACLTRIVTEQTEGWQALGVAEGKYDMSASSEAQPASKALLNSKDGHWSPTDENRDTEKSWLQIDFGSPKEVVGVGTQGGSDDSLEHWTERYEVHGSLDGDTWKTLRNEMGDELFLGNGDRDTIIRHALQWPAQVRYLRFFPKKWYSGCALRVEVYEFMQPPQAWWWRCDGAALAWDTGAKPLNTTATFGAGDVVGVTAGVQEGQIRRLELLRNGKVVTFMDLPADGNNPLPEDIALALSVGLRRSSTCVSLLPAPKVMEGQLPDAGGQVVPLDAHEEGMAMSIFKAIDVSGDGALDRKEFAAVLGGVRDELFEASDQEKDQKISSREWVEYCMLVKSGNGANGLILFLDAFRKKLCHIGRVVTFQDAADEKPPAWGVHVTAKPSGFTTEGMLEAARDLMPDEWAKFQQLAVDGWGGQRDETYVAMLAFLEKGENGVGKDALEWDLSQFRTAAKTLKADRLKAFPAFTESEERLAARFAVIRRLNSWVKDRLLPYVDLASILKTPFGRTLSKARGMLFGSWRTEAFDRVVNETWSRDEGSLYLNRQPQIDCKHANECDVEGTRMLFGQSSKKVEEERAFGINVFRAKDPSHNRPINISYENESGTDHGGLYRDWLDAIGDELMSTYLPLFIQTPNGRNNAGEDRGCWLLNPTPVTKASRRMFHFLGKMMGVCVRRGDVLPLSISRVTWKLLVRDVPTLEDLASADVASGESVRQLMDVALLGVGPDEFEYVFPDMHFVFHNSAGVEVPLVDGGATMKVTFDNARQFAEAVLAMRMNEANEAIECIRAGLACVIPVACLSMWSWRDLESRVCGSPEIDLQVLKKHTYYESIAEDAESVKCMWKALESFSQEDRRCFIRFCWGRSRLPPDSEDRLWKTDAGSGFKVAGASDIPATGLPRAHTCYFQIDLPPYQTVEVATDRLLFAVRNCVSMLNS